MRKLSRPQTDLFVTPLRPVELAGVERQKAVALLQALLTEAMTRPASQSADVGEKEAGHE
jgi:hypothetical protein